MTTCGEVLVKILQNYGIDTIFGIPGVHTVELYRGLEEVSMLMQILQKQNETDRM